MTVELQPNNEKCYEVGLANKTFFVMVNESGMDQIIGKQHSNDPIEVNAENSLQLASVLDKWDAPKDWGSLNGVPGGIKEILVRFLKDCGGFTTR